MWRGKWGAGFVIRQALQEGLRAPDFIRKMNETSMFAPCYIIIATSCSGIVISKGLGAPTTRHLEIESALVQTNHDVDHEYANF